MNGKWKKIYLNLQNRIIIIRCVCVCRGGGVSRRFYRPLINLCPSVNLPRLPGNLKALDIPYSIISWATLPFYAHDGQGHHWADHGDVLDVSHEGAQEGAETPCVGEESCQLRERKNSHIYIYKDAYFSLSLPNIACKHLFLFFYTTSICLMDKKLFFFIFAAQRGYWFTMELF